MKFSKYGGQKLLPPFNSWWLSVLVRFASIRSGFWVPFGGAKSGWRLHCGVFGFFFFFYFGWRLFFFWRGFWDKAAAVSVCVCVLSAMTASAIAPPAAPYWHLWVWALCVCAVYVCAAYLCVCEAVGELALTQVYGYGCETLFIYEP